MTTKAFYEELSINNVALIWFAWLQIAEGLVITKMSLELQHLKSYHCMKAVAVKVTSPDASYMYRQC